MLVFDFSFWHIPKKEKLIFLIHYLDSPKQILTRPLPSHVPSSFHTASINRQINSGRTVWGCWWSQRMFVYSHFHLNFSICFHNVLKLLLLELAPSIKPNVMRTVRNGSRIKRIKSADWRMKSARNHFSICTTESEITRVSIPCIHTSTGCPM